MKKKVRQWRVDERYEGQRPPSRIRKKSWAVESVEHDEQESDDVENRQRLAFEGEDEWLREPRCPIDTAAWGPRRDVRKLPEYSVGLVDEGYLRDNKEEKEVPA